MNRKQMVQKQQLRFMLLNLLTFSIIFTVFGIIIFSTLQNTLFSETDEQLYELRDVITGDAAAQTPSVFAPTRPLEEQTRENLNPRIIMLNWSENGTNINRDQIGILLYQNYFRDYEPPLQNINTISNMTVNDTYTFRYILFAEQNIFGETFYTQLLVNIDAEQTILRNFRQLIVLCSLIFILLSISASYYLSRKMMDPLIQSWNKQSEFVENASHELRTPLTVIQNKLELLLTAPQEKIMNRFENIALSLSETRRLSKLTSDLLTLARADSAEVQLEKKQLSLDDFIKRVSAPYQEIAESQQKQLQLQLEGNITIAADEVRLHQLLVILLDNALKYTGEEDSITIRTFAEDQAAVIEVEDTGSGIKAASLPYVFDRFYREDKARSRATGGTGLGLSIAQWIVQTHAGNITVSSEEGKGTAFRVTLPK